MRAAISVGLPAALLAIGLFAGHLRSSEWSWRSPLLAELNQLTALEPVRALPRTEAAIAMVEAKHQLTVGRPYAAWETLRAHVEVGGVVGSSVVLLAAQAAADWGGWKEVRATLGELSWLGEVAGGDGLFLLARAEEELGSVTAAIDRYGQYLGVPGASRRSDALARRASLLAGQGEHRAAAAVYEAAAAEAPDVADWLRVKQVEALLAAGEPSAADVAAGHSGGSAPARVRRATLEVEARLAAGQPERALQRLEVETRALRGDGASLEAARLQLDRARLLLPGPNAATARDLIRTVAIDAAVPAPMRLEAAQALGELTDRTVAEEMARADAYEAAARPGLAARSLRLALEAGANDTPAQRLRLARLLYAERDYGPARTAFQRAAGLIEDRELKAESELHAARSAHRAGGTTRAQQTARQTALTEYRRIVENYAGTAAAGTALFLLGDAASNNQAGLGLYRRAAAVTHSPDAVESLYRVGDRSLRLDDTAGAIRAWEEYIARYPKGEQSARVAYEVGKLHTRAGRRPAAQTMFMAAMRAEPTSYYAIRAGEHLGLNSLDSVLAEPRPWIGLASEPAEAAAVLRRLDRLTAFGLTDAWQAEYDAALRGFQRHPLARLVLAEGLRDRNHPVEALRLGRQLLGEREGEWDERLLRVVFPFPYRELIVAESRRAGIDPFLYAGLVRQESTFRATVKSRVGATGLGQIMPATGRWLAPSIGIRNYEDALLEVPEINVRMGTKYMADLLRRYNGEADLALAGYNAGPSRADRWRRQFNHGRDTDAFRAAIPFNETREYVMIVLRNEAIYRRLYQGSGSGVTGR